MPALLTSTSSVPKCRVVAATTAAQLSSLVTSSGSNRAEAPIASATRRPSSSSTSAITTWAPSRANMRAVAAPMPDAAPEMMATLSASLITVSSLSLECCSAAGEVRPALLGEGRYCFLVVLGKVRLRLKTEAQVHHRMGKLTQRDIDGLLGPADRPHRAASQSPGQPINLLIELIGRHDVVDQPDTLGLRRRHLVAGKQVLFGAGEADELRPDQRATVTRYQAGVDMRVTDLGVVGRDDDVAEQRNCRAESDGMAIDPRDDRLVAFQHAEHDPPRLWHTGIPRVRIVDLLLHGDHVPAGRKRSTRPGQDDNMHVGIVVHIVPDAGHRGVHGPGERVEGLGRVQGYREHLVLSPHQYAAILGIIVCHHFLL